MSFVIPRVTLFSLDTKVYFFCFQKRHASLVSFGFHGNFACSINEADQLAAVQFTPQGPGGYFNRLACGAEDRWSGKLWKRTGMENGRVFKEI